jgi:hypothetical protein
VQRRLAECDVKTFMVLQASFLEHLSKRAQLKFLGFEENNAESSIWISTPSSLLSLLVPSTSC